MNDSPHSNHLARTVGGSGHQIRRALVLGGGGSTGNAWLIGIVAGLAEYGIDVTAADLTVGTSAGATAAAQLSGAPASELLSAILSEGGPITTVPLSSGAGRAATGQVPEHLERLRAIIAESDDLADMRRRIGAAALARDASSDDWHSRWRTTVASRLPGERWPESELAITAVDASTGEPIVFTRDGGVDLVDAVAASTSGGGRAYRIGDRRYIDGGYRTNAENADLASGCARVLVLSPLGGRSFHPVAWGTHLDAQVESLRAQGTLVEVVFPSPDDAHLFGAAAMDPALRATAARAGYEQAKTLALQLSALWR